MRCEICGIREATQRHHRFPQYARYRRRYGKMIDEPFNIIPACGVCNGSHANIPEWAKWCEYEFRLEAAARGYKLPGPMKSYKQKV